MTEMWDDVASLARSSPDNISKAFKAVPLAVVTAALWIHP